MDRATMQVVFKEIDKRIKVINDRVVTTDEGKAQIKRLASLFVNLRIELTRLEDKANEQMANDLETYARLS